MFRLFIFFIAAFSSLLSFETTNLQLLYSNNFKGDAFIYDTVDGEKTTLTFEHYRTFEYGDFFMFVDAMEGERFDGVKSSLYSEFSPRFSLSKISNSDLTLGIFKDFYLASQFNVGDAYRAYLVGLGTDIVLSGFKFINLNLYHKSENIQTQDTWQITTAYETQSFWNLHLSGFMDVTSRDINTQNQLLYDLAQLFGSKEELYGGVEWLFYEYKYEAREYKTSLLQAMIKYKF